jgi:hypothetical protein
LNLCGCAKEEAAEKEIVIGWLWDFTGPACLGVKQMYYGLQDYLRTVEEETPMPGAKIKVITFDEKGDLARHPP